MKTIFKLFPALFATAVPAAMAVELAGFPLPAVADPISLFVAFVVTFLTQTVVTDYSKPRRELATLAKASTEKSSNPLAA